MKQIIVISALCMLMSVGLWAQGDIRKELFSAEKVMEHRQAIGLKPNQADAIKKIHNESAGAFQTLKWDLDYEQELLDSLVAMNQPDTKKVSQQFDKVMALEKELKKMRMMSLIGIKKVLEPEQIEKLKEVDFVEGKLKVTKSKTNFFPYNPPTLKYVEVEEEVEGKKVPLIYFNVNGKLTEHKGDLGTIETDNIMSIDVLKGASAIEKVGPKGANGVVIITRKQ